MSDFIAKAMQSGRVKPLDDAFEEFLVEREDHKGKADYFAGARN